MSKRLLIPLMAALVLFAAPSAARRASHAHTTPLSGIEAGAGECDVEEHESVVDSVDLYADRSQLVALPQAEPRAGEPGDGIALGRAERGQPQCRGPPSA